MSSCFQEVFTQRSWYKRNAKPRTLFFHVMEKYLVTYLRLLKGQHLNCTDLSLIYLFTLLSWHFLNSILETTCCPHPWLVVCWLCCQLDHPLEKEKDQSGSAVFHLLILINDIVKWFTVCSVIFCTMFCKPSIIMFSIPPQNIRWYSVDWYTFLWRKLCRICWCIKTISSVDAFLYHCH